MKSLISKDTIQEPCFKEIFILYRLASEDKSSPGIKGNNITSGSKKSGSKISTKARNTGSNIIIADNNSPRVGETSLSQSNNAKSPILAAKEAW